MANILIGKILKPQGIKGEVKVMAYTNDLDRFLHYSKFIIDNKNYVVKKIRHDNSCAYILFDDIINMNSAEMLRNKELYICDSDLPKLSDNEYYLYELVDSKILSTTGRELGKIVFVNDDTRNTVVNAIINGRKAAFPLVKKTISKFDRINRILEVFEKELYEVTLFED